MSNLQMKLWAPTAKSAWLHALGRKISMNRCADFARSGWWVSPPLDVTASQLGDYHVSVEDGEARPDPRSAWQPYGVAGPSRLIDHAAFQWNDQQFQPPPLSSGVIYELHIGTFSPQGTFQGAIQRLDHLVRLGITHVELMPIAEFPGQYGWGYDGVCLYAPASFYGGPDGLKQFVDACHSRGLAVILDVVYNHLGPVGNHLAEFGPYFSSQHKTPWGPAINFDGAHSDGVRSFFIDNALQWLRDYHIDALRLDAVHAIVDPTSLPFLEQLAVEVDRLASHLGKHKYLIAESDLNDPRLIRAREAGGFGLDAQWCDDFHHALHTALSGESSGYYADFSGLEMLARAFQHPYLYIGQHSPARRRSHGRPAYPLTGHRFVSYTQNHDQIGNRARGDRLSHLIGPQRARIAAVLLLCSPYIPQLFQGEEWDTSRPFLYFADWSLEPELADAVRKGRQDEFAVFGWKPEDLPDPSDPETFAACRLDWEALNSDSGREMFEWYAQVIRLRKRFRHLTDGALDRLSACCDQSSHWLRIVRGPIVVCVNLADHSQSIDLPCDFVNAIADDQDPPSWRILLDSAAPRKLDASTIFRDRASIEVPSNTVIVLERLSDYSIEIA